MKRTLCATLLAIAACAHAEGDTAPLRDEGLSLRLDRSSLELRLGAQRLTAGYPRWREAGLLLTVPAGSHVWRAEVAATDRFGERGTWLSVMDTFTIDPDWYASIAAALGDGAFYLPRTRIDAFIHRKLLADRSLVAFAGVSGARAPDGHSDRAIEAGAILYFAAPWVLQAALRFNESDPGGVRTRQQYVALSRMGGADQWTLRYGWGREGYLAIAPGNALVDFASREASLRWRHALDRDSGVTLALEHYRNPTYRRNGIALGYFVLLP